MAVGLVVGEQVVHRGGALVEHGLFGYAHVRRVERALVTEYRDAVRSALDHLDADAGTDEVVAIAELAEIVRGYEDIKLARVGQFRAQIEAALADLTGRRQVGAADPS
ncbi:DUF6537 domain-containing protein [Pseudonocardia xinjiangensis]|uniref:DUF6537 domain-containing protein n=1 Tax=Pseudonocardia xinjiangensis TaxID=75289 RepID=UPI003D8D7AF3